MPRKPVGRKGTSSSTFPGSWSPGEAGKGISFTPPLDEITTTPLSVLGLRRLVGSYTGSAIRVREGSEAEVDVGFDSNGEVSLDSPTSTAGTTLGQYADGNDVFVTKVYNQAASGSTYDALQSTAGYQPTIVTSGTLNADGIVFDGSDDRFSTIWKPATSNDNTILVVGKLDSDAGSSDYGWFSVLDGWNDGIEYRVNVSGQFQYAYNSTDLLVSATVTNFNVGIASMESSLSSGEQQFVLNGTGQSPGDATGNISLGTYESVEIGTRNGGNYPIPGALKEMMYFDSKVPSGQQTLLSDNATKYFGI